MPKSNRNPNNNDDDQKEDGQAAKSQSPEKRPRVSEQTTRKLKEDLTTIGANIGVCQHVLKLLGARPQLWKRAEFKDIREAVQVIKSRPAEYPSMMGDAMPNGSTVQSQAENVGRTPTLTTN